MFVSFFFHITSVPASNQDVAFFCSLNKSEFGIKWMVLISGVTFERAKVTQTRRLMKKEQISILLLLNKAVQTLRKRRESQRKYLRETLWFLCVTL